MEFEPESLTVSCVVTEAMLDSTLGCGDTIKFSMAMMVALMEQAAKQLAARYLSDGLTTVGVMMNTTHVAPTVSGVTVYATATLLEHSEGQFYFEITARDNMGIIGEATHQRVAVSIDKFNEKARIRGGV
ncbi:MAG: thioesterase family protein [Acutalibacteraceae bacterium]